MQQTHSAQYGVTLADVALGAFEWVFSTQGMSDDLVRHTRPIGIYTRSFRSHFTKIEKWPSPGKSLMPSPVDASPVRKSRRANTVSLTVVQDLCLQGPQTGPPRHWYLNQGEEHKFCGQ